MAGIELRPHTAIGRSGEVIEFDQWMIYDNGLHCGYVGFNPGSPINLFNVAKSKELKLRKAITEKLGEVRPVAVPPTDEQVNEHLRGKK